MAAVSEARGEVKFVDKKQVQKIVAEQNAQMGFVPDPTATPQKAREMMRALGIRPEDNLGSRGIIAARDEE
jgi:hypothetical protein